MSLDLPYNFFYVEYLYLDGFFFINSNPFMYFKLKKLWVFWAFLWHFLILNNFFFLNCHDSSFILFLTICSNFWGMESDLAKKITTQFFFYFLGYFILFIIFFSHVTLFFISKKLLHIVRNIIKEGSWQLVKKQQNYSKSKNVKKKCPKNSKFLV